MGEHMTKIPGEKKWNYVMNLNILLGKRDIKSLYSIPQCLRHRRQCLFFE